MSKIRTKTVYLDVQNKEHDSAELALKANNDFKESFINSRVIYKIEAILQEVPDFKDWYRTETHYKLYHIAKYLTTTDLKAANRKISKLKKEAEQEFNEQYPDTPL